MGWVMMNERDLTVQANREALEDALAASENAV
jgi:hypothetical protein